MFGQGVRVWSISLCAHPIRPYEMKWEIEECMETTKKKPLEIRRTGDMKFLSWSFFKY